MLVHPDKNMGNEKAAEAFKKLQNAYEVILLVCLVKKLFFNSLLCIFRSIIILHFVF